MIHVLRLDKSDNVDSIQKDRLAGILDFALKNREFKLLRDKEVFFKLADKGEIEKVLFAVKVPLNGYTPEWNEFMGSLSVNPNILYGATGGIIVDGEGNLYTKDLGRKLIFHANRSGLRFPGRPLVEATGDLYNFSTRASLNSIDNMEAYENAARELIEKLEEEEAYIDVKKVLAIHAGNRETSNTLALLDMVKRGMVDGITYSEISIRNGEIVDCRGCGFESCKHYGEKGECFYGGVMVDRVYPAILESDALILVTPNYNDSVSANMLALFNRLTALFYNNSFNDKRIYALIVSGYSGGDILAQQIIGVLNCNKGFQLPPDFAMIESANDPGSIFSVEGIEDRAYEFGKKILV